MRQPKPSSGDIPAEPLDKFWTTTASGRRVYPLAGKGDFVIEDIAFALSRVARWSGHTVDDPRSGGYSVAQHCCAVFDAIMKDGPRTASRMRLALAGLLHDAEEAYTIDLPGHWKHLIHVATPHGFIAWEEIASRLMGGILYGLGLPELSRYLTRVKPFDLAAARIEARLIMGPVMGLEASEGTPPPVWTPERARSEFLTRYAKTRYDNRYDTGGGARWERLAFAPTRSCTWVTLRLEDGQEVEAHFAEDLTGEEQPVFSGWFKRCPSGSGFVGVHPAPVAWRPLADGWGGRAGRWHPPRAEREES